MSGYVFTKYLKEVNKYSLLTKEQELILSKKIKNGCKESLELLINSNLRLVIRIAKMHSSNSHELMDIIQEGNMGLITAAKKFSAGFNVRFASYASFWIQRSILTYLSDSDKIIRLPALKKIILKKIKDFRFKYKIDNGREPSLDEIAESLLIKKKHVLEIQNFIESNTCSLDEFIEKEPENKKTLYDYVFADEIYQPEYVFLQKEIRFHIMKIINMLDRCERDILVSRYCLDGSDKVITFRKLGIKYGVSAEAIRQTEIRILKKLRLKRFMIREAVPF